MMWLLAGTVGMTTKGNPPGSIAEMHLPLTWVGLGMLIATVITWLVFRWRKARSNRRLNSPRLLLRELFRIHQLTWADRSLLLRTAKSQKVGNPARLFLESDLWQQAMAVEKSPRRKRRLKSLQAKLFCTA